MQTNINQTLPTKLKKDVEIVVKKMPSITNFANVYAEFTPLSINLTSLISSRIFKLTNTEFEHLTIKMPKKEEIIIPQTFDFIKPQDKIPEFSNSIIDSETNSIASFENIDRLEKNNKLLEKKVDNLSLEKKDNFTEYNIEEQSFQTVLINNTDELDKEISVEISPNNFTRKKMEINKEIEDNVVEGVSTMEIVENISLELNIIPNPMVETEEDLTNKLLPETSFTKKIKVKRGPKPVTEKQKKTAQISRKRKKEINLDSEQDVEDQDFILTKRRFF